MSSRRHCAAALAGLVGVPLAGAQAGAEMELASCVGGSPALRAAASAERALLDLGDRDRFEMAARARYPLYQRGGLVPSQVLLIRRGTRWQYVTLSPGGDGGLCFSAVFAAERFDFTPGWIAKYQPRAADPAD